MSDGFVCGIDFGGSKMAIATARLDGRVVERTRLETDARRGAAQAVRRALHAAGKLIEQTAAAGVGRLAAAGAVSPGVVRDDGIALAPNVPGWGELALGALLRDELGVDDVAVANDANAAGLAELRWGALQGADPALYLSLGTGVGAAVLIGGRIVCGAHGAAGEVGYSAAVADTALCADGRAPLEERAGGRFIAARASDLAGRPLTGPEAFTQPQGPVRDLVQGALDELAAHVANMAILIDPAAIALGGGMMASGERILDALQRRLSRAVPFPPRLVTARFLTDAALHGALALAIDAATGSAAAAPLEWASR